MLLEDQKASVILSCVMRCGCVASVPSSADCVCQVRTHAPPDQRCGTHMKYYSSSGLTYSGYRSQHARYEVKRGQAAAKASYCVALA